MNIAFLNVADRARNNVKIISRRGEYPPLTTQPTHDQLPRIAIPIRVYPCTISTSTPTRSSRLTLYEASQNLTPRLQQRMAGDNLQKPLQPFPAVLDNIIREPIRKHLPRQRGNGDARALPLEDIAEVLEVRVAAAHDRVLQFEGGDVGAAD